MVSNVAASRRGIFNRQQSLNVGDQEEFRVVPPSSLQQEGGEATGPFKDARRSRLWPPPLRATRDTLDVAASVLTQSFVSLGEVGERVLSATVLGDNWIGLCCPDEGFWVIVAVIDPFDDGGLEFADGVEGAAPDALACDFSKQALDEIEPRAGCRG